MPGAGYKVSWVSGLPVVATPAEIDASNVAELGKALLSCADGGNPTVVIDMSETVFCDSTGLHQLVRARADAIAAGGEVRLVIRADTVLRLFAIMGVDSLFPVFATLEEAVASAPTGDDRSGAAEWRTAEGIAEVTMSDPTMSAASFHALYERLRGQARWGAADRRGALNHITPARVAAAAAEVRAGRTVTLAAPMASSAADNPEPGARHMKRLPGEPSDVPGVSFAADQIVMNVHGDVDSHIDALCHVSYEGELYNGVPSGVVTSRGAAELSIDDAARDGIVGRGVLLDIARLRGVAWLEPGDHVTAAELAAAEEAQQVQVGPGDLLFVRLGHRRRRHELGPWDVARSRAGLHPDAAEYLAERQVAVLGSDSNSDTAPSVVDGVAFPVHVLALNALGVHLLDYLQFDDLQTVCEAAGRWSFLCVIAPLRLLGATGSPVNPIAIL